MKLTDEQKAALTAAATEAGLAPDEVIAAAELESAASDGGPATPPATTAEKPNLFQYHLPFLRVRELRAVWLGLTERIDGDDMTTGAWLAKYGGGTGGGTTA